MDRSAGPKDGGRDKGMGTEEVELSMPSVGMPSMTGLVPENLRIPRPSSLPDLNDLPKYDFTKSSPRSEDESLDDDFSSFSQSFKFATHSTATFSTVSEDEDTRTAMTLSGVQGQQMAKELQKALHHQGSVRKPNIAIAGEGDEDDMEFPDSDRNYTISGAGADQLAKEIRFAISHPTHGSVKQADKTGHSGIRKRRLSGSCETVLEGPEFEPTIQSSDAQPGPKSPEYTRFKSPMMHKINKEMKQMHLLCDAVESKMPQNGKHLRDSLRTTQHLMKRLEQSHEFREKDPLILNRLVGMRRKTQFKQNMLNLPSTQHKKRKIVLNVVMSLVCIGFLAILGRGDYRPYDKELGELVTVTSGQQRTYSLNDSPNKRIEVHLTVPPWGSINSDSSAEGNSALGNGATTAGILVMLQMQQQSDSWVTIGEAEKCSFANESARECFFAFSAEKLMDGRTGSLQFAYSLVQDSVSQYAIPFNAHVRQYGILGQAKIWLACGLLVVALFLIAFELLHRTLVAMVGSFFMLLLLLALDEAPDLQQVLEWMDEGALGLLFGMMVIVGKFSRTGLFELVTIKVLGISKGNKWTMTVFLCALTGFLSAFLDNVTTVLLIAPVTLSLAKVLDIDPIPFLVAEVIFSNIGGAATMIGDPPNIIVGNALSHEVNFMDFIYALTPITIIAFVPCMFFLRFLYRKKVVGQVDQEKYYSALRLRKTYTIKDKHLLIQSSIVLTTVIIGFLLHPVHHIEPAWIAIFGAVLLLVFSSPHEIHDDLEVIEWETLLFFAALFVMIEAMSAVGLIREIGNLLIRLIGTVPAGGRMEVAILLVTSVSAIVSAFLDNIPYTATMIPVMVQLSEADLGLGLKPLAWSLCLGACLGGNGSLLGASANIVVAGIAHREGHHITFKEFFRTGFPIMCMSVVIAIIYLELRYAL